MSEKLSLRTNANGDIYVYIEDTSGASLAFGADSANGVVALNTLGTTNVQPLESTANMTIDPAANGDILFRPHGTGKSEFNTGNVQITEKSLYMPHTDGDGVNGCIFTYQPFFGTHVRYVSFPDDFNIYIGSEVGTFPNPVGVGYNIVMGAERTFQAVTGGTNDNVVMGRTAMENFTGDLLTTPGNNIAIGALTLGELLTGSNNITLGRASGSSYTSSESDNICLSNTGTLGESGAIRIGSSGSHSKAYLAGVHSVTPGGASTQLMIMDNMGQMGTSAGGSLFASSFATDSGTATPAAGVITIAGGLNITTSGAASTVTVNVGEIVGVTNSGASTVPYIATGTGQLGTVPGGAVLMNTGTQSLSISSDASATTVAIATGAAVKGLTLGSTNSTSASTLQSGSGALNVTSTNGALTINSGTGALSISNDASATTLTIGTGGAVKGVTLGSTNSTSATTVQSGSGALALTSTNGTWTGNSGTGALGLSTDASATTVSIATGGAVKTTTLGSTNSTSATTVQSGSGALNITATNGALTANSGTGALGISTDASATTVSFATGAAVKGVTLGSTNSTSATTVQSGSGALNVTSTNGTMTINSGTGALSISSDASATTVNIATGAAAKTVTLGSTNSTSLLALKYGTADFTLASATGTVMSALDTGEITYALQPAFLAFLPSPVNNVTGAGASFTLGTTTALTEIFDQNSDFNTNGTFTAPVTGRYHMSVSVLLSGCTVATTFNLTFVTSNRSYLFQNQRVAGSSNFAVVATGLVDMDAADTMTVTIVASGEAGSTVDVYGDAVPTTFISGYLAC